VTAIYSFTRTHLHQMTGVRNW